MTRSELIEFEGLVTNRMIQSLGVPAHMLQGSLTFPRAERAAWDVELGIRRDIEPMTDAEVLEALGEDLSWEPKRKRAVSNPDCPPYDPRLGL